MKKFLYCLELEAGSRLIAGYCAATNVAYIIALFSIYSHMDVKKVGENFLIFLRSCEKKNLEKFDRKKCGIYEEF